MGEKLRYILKGAGSVLEFWPADVPPQSDFDREVSSFLRCRPSDYESILMDMRRSMLSQLDKLPEHERSAQKRRLRSEYRFDHERRIGIKAEPRSRDEHQLEFSFSES